MKNRERQRANRRMKEEMLDLHDFCGIQDPTPYTAVKNIIRREEQALPYSPAEDNTLLMRRTTA